MERKTIKQILLNYGYSEETIKKMFQGKTRPTLKKALDLEKNYNLPCYAWQDIKSYISQQNSKTQQKQ